MNALNIVPDKLPRFPYIPLSSVTEDIKPSIVDLDNIDQFNGKNVFVTLKNDHHMVGLFETQGDKYVFATVGQSAPFPIDKINTIREV